MTKIVAQAPLPELAEIEKIAAEFAELADIRREDVVSCAGHEFPIYSFAFGPETSSHPTVLFVGGVHGLERVGTQIVVSYLRTFCELLKWDKCLKDLLKQVRILFYPLVNPGGMFRSTRANPRGVDLMRNAPISAEPNSVFPLVGGHRLSSLLPWYRGKVGEPMEVEAKALCRFVRRELFNAPVCISLDMHSGFGLKDRLWFPYARSLEPFADIEYIYKLNDLLNKTYPNHIYLVEPQSLSYVTHGDLWDYLYEEHSKENPNSLFLPLSLELGSWTWVKKNPKQIFSFAGAFNPILPHRMQRVFRRHLILFDFLIRAALSSEGWYEEASKHAETLKTEAIKHWYGKSQKSLGVAARLGSRTSSLVRVP